MKSVFSLVIMMLLFSCNSKETKKEEAPQPPKVEDNGTRITFKDKAIFKLFKTETIADGSITGDLVSVGLVGATVLGSDSGSSNNIVLFENPELASNYTQLIQHQINIKQISNVNIKQRQIELARAKDLNLHGAMTGQELLNTQTALSMEMTNLSNEKAAIIEHEAMLKSAGFDPDLLRRAKKGTAYLVSDIPENQISKLKVGDICRIQFTAYPNDKFTGKIEAIADRVDFTTRMVKLRIGLDNTNNKLKVGMYANVAFGLESDNTMSVPKMAIVTVQGMNYVFIQKDDAQFERRKVEVGQQIGDRVVVFSGINKGEKVVTQGIMQLKGLSFGY
ncbi:MULTISPECIES: efflux RND transporter periplasmic adaptor subunit [Flavobacterium]|uniref:efflux RND transporter periplasmic adaptor subunit n=1 Tax=Flavobacterium TaxID=237 RepID=UPI00086E1721|nr:MULTISPECIES: efflux RND transporter periplasmic adaptor subunit [Flavobacterium]MBN9285421.1 efflux RND transporter periplasmic adaptor subunit [Flavobacterium sp.]ODS84412.1 MAG: efflux transporter periplasmic adaptor subunit [Chryseobacterium sp. SCN 40-13]OJV71700.1 MAG: efflux transporter periplasmic adaptor subunit [Flavobacterium sp. 40-81]